MHLIDWITRELRPRPVDSTAALYEHMESQSGFSLPVIYQPFDATKAGHWADRGFTWEYLETTGGGDLLDFGPGDGWPSLLVAPYCRSVVGLDASPLRLQVCEANAARLGISNFRTALYRPGEPLPFADESFDAITAAHSVEQTPDPRAILREMHRVLRPGGRLRLAYEAAEWYRGQERRVEVMNSRTGGSLLYATDTLIAEETAIYYALVVDAPQSDVQALVDRQEIDTLAELTRDAMTYQLRLPGCRTWQTWLQEAGFTSAVPTHSGGQFAGRLFKQMPPEQRPTDMAGVDALLSPAVKVVTALEAPPHLSPHITATK